MKTHEIYECEICESEFLTKEEAKECEEGHTLAEVIERQRYYPHSRNSRYPDELIVSMDDGTHARYSFVCETVWKPSIEIRSASSGRHAR